jgi:hypothetical protein
MGCAERVHDAVELRVCCRGSECVSDVRAVACVRVWVGVARRLGVLRVRARPWRDRRRPLRGALRRRLLVRLSG